MVLWIAPQNALILKLIGEQNLDICLQETHFNNSDNLNEIFKDFKLGVAILFKTDLDILIIKIVKDEEGRTLSLLCQFN